MGNKVYGEFTVRYWADADAFAKEYGVGAGAALECAGDDFTGQATMVPDGQEAWKGAEVVAPRPFLLNDHTRRELMTAYNNWRAVGTVLSHREESDDDAPDSSEFHAHDDDAADLYGELAAFLFDTDDCGHQEVTTKSKAGGYVVSCDNCPATWKVEDGEVVTD